MKRAIIYSLILHLLLFSLFFFLKEPKREQRKEPFYAKLVTPEELQKLLNRGLPEKSDSIRPFRGIPPVPKPESTPPMKREREISKNLPKKLEQQETKSYQQRDRISEQLSSTGSPLQKEEPPSVEGSKRRQEGLTHERLFDKEIIGKLAKRDKEPSEESPITFSAKEFRYQGYLQRLKEKIESIWKYPRDAAERGIYGDLYIRFTILKNGRLGAVELIRTSGYKSLDDAALKALKDGEPYWPLPDEWGRDGLTITGHFIYTYYGSYIR